MSSTLKVRASLEFHLAKGHGGDCYLKENQSQFSETRRLKNLVKKTLRIRHMKLIRVTHCVTLKTPAKTLSVDEAHTRMKRRTDRRCACATVDFGGDRQSDESGST